MATDINSQSAVKFPKVVAGEYTVLFEGEPVGLIVGGRYDGASGWILKKRYPGELKTDHGFLTLKSAKEDATRWLTEPPF